MSVDNAHKRLAIMNAPLSDSEKDEYAELCRKFTVAKAEKNYEVSDKLRSDLLRWQEGYSDQDFIKMAQTGNYRFHPFFFDAAYVRRARLESLT